MLSRDDTYIDLITVHADDDTLTAGTVSGVILRSGSRDCTSRAAVTTIDAGVYAVAVPLAEASDPSVCQLRATVTRTSDGKTTLWKSTPFRVGGVGLTARNIRDLAERLHEFVPPGGVERVYDLLMRAADARVQLSGRQVYTLTAHDALKAVNYTAPDNTGIQNAAANTSVLMTRLTSERASHLDKLNVSGTLLNTANVTVSSGKIEANVVEFDGVLVEIAGTTGTIGMVRGQTISTLTNQTVADAMKLAPSAGAAATGSVQDKLDDAGGGGLTPEQESTLNQINQIKALIQAKD